MKKRCYGPITKKLHEDMRRFQNRAPVERVRSQALAPLVLAVETQNEMTADKQAPNPMLWWRRNQGKRKRRRAPGAGNGPDHQNHAQQPMGNNDHADSPGFSKATVACGKESGASEEPPNRGRFRSKSAAYIRVFFV